MSNINNVPIQMFSMTNTTGEMVPLRFRFEDSEHLIRTIHINQILGSQEHNYVGQQCVKYICSTVQDSKEVLFEVKYMLTSHKWILSKLLN